MLVTVATEQRCAGSDLWSGSFLIHCPNIPANGPMISLALRHSTYYNTVGCIVLRTYQPPVRLCIAFGGLMDRRQAISMIADLDSPELFTRYECIVSSIGKRRAHRVSQLIRCSTSFVVRPGAARIWALQDQRELRSRLCYGLS